MNMPPGDAPGITVIVPAYNEAEALPETIADIDAFFRTRPDLPCDIIICDDGSTDATPAVCADLAARYPAVRVRRAERNGGMGAAIKLGLAAAAREYLYVHPADNQFAITCCGAMLDTIGDADLVIGSRPVKDESYSPLRTFLSDFQYTLVRVLLGVDLQYHVGLNLYRHRIFATVRPVFNSCVLNVEIVVKARLQRYALRSLLVDVRPRRHGTSRQMLTRNFLRTFADFLLMFVYLTLWRATGHARRRV